MANRGRPPKYETPEDLQSIVDEYFEECDQTGTPFTVSGLGLALDLSRQGILEYQDKPAFSDIIKKAKARIMAQLEEGLANGSGNPVGKIFILKNMGRESFRDKPEETAGSITINIDIPGLDMSEYKVIGSKDKVQPALEQPSFDIPILGESEN